MRKAERREQAMLDWVLSFITSPWIYVIVFAATAVDAFFPPVPSGALVVTLGAFAATGDPEVAGLLTAAATGAFVGDTIAYLLGRHVVRLRRRTSTGRTNVTATRVRRALAGWGGAMLILARFVPGGRTVAMVTAGSVRYPLRRFWFFTAVAGAAWGTYTTAIGYLGGELFDSAVPGAVGGVVLASGLSLAVTAVSRRRGGAKVYRDCGAEPSRHPDQLARPRPVAGHPLRDVPP
jgi:membrane protein DedA with SNARE-associated domain